MTAPTDPRPDGPLPADASGVVVMAVHRPDPVLLRRQVASVQAQTAAGWRCLVGLDGVDPPTRQLLDALVGDDPRFDVVEYPDNVGVYRHFERLLADLPADAAWVALADQDDRWYPDKLDTLLATLRQPGVTAVTGLARLVDQHGVVLGRTRRRPGGLAATLLHNQLTGSLSVLRRSVVDLALPFPPATDIAIHDHWLAVCAAWTGRIELCDEVVQDYVQHEGNVLGEARTRTAGETRRVDQLGGVRPFLGHLVRHRWGWRVAMARGLLDRSEHRHVPVLVRAVGRGGPAPSPPRRRVGRP